MSYSEPPPPPQYGDAGGQKPPGQPPANNLVWAILTTLFCCLPLGVVSIVFAAQVNGKWASGDYTGAQDSAKKAKNFAMWSAIVGVVGIVLYIILVVAIGVGSNSSTNY
ncbi:CD225/dispanin family protein [Nocardioides acrostichi]|uniref:CD225/dispanin family protein n=1 Tax=Nocardioides acrostichi TaxID=2784339 RepID=A0A930Y9R9_9ACTN|nr:CD225/dispanin family protein [Nocardioides acrostichi]MBF4160658.1 CD225/dispanin family protein [Nocardioides acrostichi]